MEVRNADNGLAPLSPLSAAAPSKQSKPCPPAVDTKSVTQRLQKELMALMMSGDLGVSAFPEGENIFCWIGTIEGGMGTSYEGLSYKLSLRFPLDYPFKPPQVKFETACFHPNVDQYGNICLDILQDMWSSAYDCRTILLSIQSLLGEPNIESPLNIYAANIWNNQEASDPICPMTCCISIGIESGCPFDSEVLLYNQDGLTEYKKIVHNQYLEGGDMLDR